VVGVVESKEVGGFVYYFGLWYFNVSPLNRRGRLCHFWGAKSNQKALVIGNAFLPHKAYALQNRQNLGL
jgi:hypothetical protein